MAAKIVIPDFREELLAVVHRYKAEKNIRAELSRERAQNCIDLIDIISSDDYEHSGQLIQAITNYCGKYVLTGFSFLGLVRVPTGHSYLLGLLKQVLDKYPRAVRIEMELAIAKEKLVTSEAINVAGLKAKVDELSTALKREQELRTNAIEERNILVVEFRKIREQLRVENEHSARLSLEIGDLKTTVRQLSQTVTGEGGTWQKTLPMPVLIRDDAAQSHQGSGGTPASLIEIAANAW